MQVTLKIFRYNPEVDTKFHYETYTIEGQETDRILDLLEHVKGYNDGTLSFRRSCAHGVCGSDRSEERRVGKEGRGRRSPCQSNIKRARVLQAGRGGRQTGCD